ncbi:uncharacterized protein [Periplaneta americana]|uniref:uncharacterized protein n=1 Tax=Periplaneta americana TaxID=6978 RepID=UPI0037E8C579
MNRRKLSQNEKEWTGTSARMQDKEKDASCPHPCSKCSMEQLDIGDEQLSIQQGKKWPQYIAALTATLGGMYSGSVMGWSSPALPYLQAPLVEDIANLTLNVSLHGGAGVSDNQAAWIGSLAPLGALFGAVPAGYLSEVMGRKMLLLLLCLPSVIGWILIIVSQQAVAYIYAGRFIGGFAIGGITVVSPLYCEEIAEDNIRGALGVYLDLMVTVGILWAYAIGAYDQYFWLSVSSCTLPVIYAATFIWMPESPVFLLSKGRLTQAKQSLHWLRGADYIPDYDVQPEISLIRRLLRDSAKIPVDSSEQQSCSIKSISHSFSWSSPTAKALKIVFGLMFFQQMSGINAVVFYTVDIFQKAGGTWSPEVATIIVGVVQVLATFFPLLIVEVIGRRFLLLLSISAMAVCLGGLSLYSYLQQSQAHNGHEYAGFIPVILVAMYIILFSIGFGPLPWFMMAELLPPEAKGWASSMSVCLNWSLVFAVTNAFPNMMRDIGPVGTYGTLAILCVLGTFFVAFAVPETRGKSREEIQNYLRGKHVVETFSSSNMIIISAGTLLTWSSPATTLLQKEDGPFVITDQQASWVGSFLALGAVFGSLPYGFLVAKVGRKIAILSVALPVTLSWVLIVATNSVVWLYVARFVAGVMLGGVSFTVPIYVAEVVEPSVRGPLASSVQVFRAAVEQGCLGYLLVWVSTSAFYIPTVSALQAATRCSTSRASRCPSCSLSCLYGCLTLLSICSQKTTAQGQRKLCNGSGASVTMWNKSYSYSRRILLMVSSFIEMLSLLVLGVYFLLKEQMQKDVDGISWLPLACLIIYIIVYCFGLGPMPWVVMAEVLPPKVKGTGGALVTSFCWIISFIITNTFQIFIDYAGRYIAFWFFAVNCALATVFIYFKVPETKGLTLQEIQTKLVGNRTNAANGSP